MVSPVATKGVSLDALRLILRMAVRMTGAVGAMITQVGASSHLPVASVDLSRSLVAIIAERMSDCRMEDGTSLQLITFRHRDPLFAISTSVRRANQQSHFVVSYIMTGDNELDRCSLVDLERLADEIAALLSPVDAVNAGRFSVPVIDAVPIPTCCICDHLQNDMGKWVPWQRFVQTQEGRMLSHTFCPHCLEKHYPELG